MKRLIARSYCILIAVCLSITSGVILAQSAPVATQTVAQAGAETKWVNCENGGSMPGAYAHCALRVEFNSLKRGEKGELLARRGFLRPLPIMANVSGDSAIALARGYHRAEMWHGGLVGVGAALIVSSLVTPRLCTTETCKHSANSVTLRNAGYAGVGLLVISIPFRVRASRLSHQAVDLYNASLSR
jgi:hypothetical protein